ncbi:unnamed protein product [Rhizopus stolonifer]
MSVGDSSTINAIGTNVITPTQDFLHIYPLAIIPDALAITLFPFKWVLNDYCISDLYFSVKSMTIQMIKKVNPAQLSDIRLLVLNDIYLFDSNCASSVSKYFTFTVHNALKPSLLFKTYYLKRGALCYDWCMSIEEFSPNNWLFSLNLCAKMLNDACESKDILNVRTAQVLTFILPAFINGPPDCSIKDSYVHNYLSPLLLSVFSSDPLLNMKCVNGQFESSNTKCIVLIAEFKRSNQNSFVESDLLKLGKQIKLTINKLVSSGVVKLKVCGVHCEGDNLNTYVMDLVSPKVYRMINIAKIKLFEKLDQISLLPRILAHLICLKNVVLETALKIEAAAVSGWTNSKRLAPCYNKIKTFHF